MNSLISEANGRFRPRRHRRDILDRTGIRHPPEPNGTSSHRSGYWIRGSTSSKRKKSTCPSRSSRVRMAVVRPTQVAHIAGYALADRPHRLWVRGLGRRVRDPRVRHAGRCRQEGVGRVDSRLLVSEGCRTIPLRCVGDGQDSSAASSSHHRNVDKPSRQIDIRRRT